MQYTRLRLAGLAVPLFALAIANVVLVTWQSSVLAAGNEHRTLAAIAGSTNYVSNSWHTGGGVHPYAIDLNSYSGAPPGQAVYYQSLYRSGTVAGYADVITYPSSTGCTGYRFEIYNSINWTYLGSLSLLHINKAPMSDSYLNTSGYTIGYAGTTKHPDCVSSGPHVHQEGTFTRNTSSASEYCEYIFCR
jgi:hypothetical protein